MVHLKGQTGLENKLSYLKILWSEIDENVLDSDLKSERISAKKFKK